MDKTRTLSLGIPIPGRIFPEVQSAPGTGDYPDQQEADVVGVHPEVGGEGPEGSRRADGCQPLLGRESPIPSRKLDPPEQARVSRCDANQHQQQNHYGELLPGYPKKSGILWGHFCILGKEDNGHELGHNKGGECRRCLSVLDATRHNLSYPIKRTNVILAAIVRYSALSCAGLKENQTIGVK